jgi:subtilisin family serine protease
MTRPTAAAVALTMIAALASAAPATAEPAIRYAGQPNAVPGSYIVVQHKGTTPAANNVTHRYSAALNGFAIHASAEEAKRLAADPRVAYVAADLTVGVPERSAGVDLVQPNPPSWGQDRVDQRLLPLDAKYVYPNTASSGSAYIIGTGIRFTHREFAGRVFFGTDVIGGVTPPGNDCQGTGTHIAGTVGGTTVGLAKQVRLIAVRVLGCTGAGSFSGVLAGIDWVTRDAVASGRPSVATLSLGGPAFQPLNDAVTNSIAAGVHYSVVAGGSNANACGFSPGSTPRATTVGATGMNDNRGSFSNFGPCLDLFAPGVNITSASFTGNSDYATISGTTPSAAHATGVAALWRHRFPADTADQVATALVANATPGVVVNPGSGSPNLLLYLGMIPM